jgi:hypothetical protein
MATSPTRTTSRSTRTAGVDVYTGERFAWAAEFCQTRTWAEAEAQAKECGAPLEQVQSLLGVIQYHAIEFIAHVMLNAIKNENQRDAEEKAS